MFSSFVLDYVIYLFISNVKRWVLIFFKFFQSLILRGSQGFFTCFRTLFSWFDHIFTINLWKNIFVWFSYHILRQQHMVYTTAGTVSGRFILDISFSIWVLCKIKTQWNLAKLKFTAFFLFGKRKSTVKPIIQRFSVLFSCFSY